jgi:hypothetical protein
MQSHSPKISALAAMAALMLALTLAPACAAPQRADTIQTAELAVNAAGAGLLVYDRQHQEDLARSGTPDEAAAALKAYRAKRATLDRALTVAVDAIFVAVRLNDQPSLDGLAKAIAEVIKDYTDLKGATP